MNYRIFILLEDQEQDEEVQKNTGENSQISKTTNSMKRQGHTGKKITLVYS